MLLLTSLLWVIFPPQVTVPGQVVDVACGVDHMVALAKSLLWASCPRQRWMKAWMFGPRPPADPRLPRRADWRLGLEPRSQLLSTGGGPGHALTSAEGRADDCTANFHWHCSLYSLFLRSCGKDIQASFYHNWSSNESSVNWFFSDSVRWEYWIFLWKFAVFNNTLNIFGFWTKWDIGCGDCGLKTELL